MDRVQTDLSAQLGRTGNRAIPRKNCPRVFNNRLEEQSKTTHSAKKSQVTTLQEKLTADTQALRFYLEQDVKGSMAGWFDIDARQGPILAQIDSLQKIWELWERITSGCLSRAGSISISS